MNGIKMESQVPCWALKHWLVSC